MKIGPKQAESPRKQNGPSGYKSGANSLRVRRIVKSRKKTCRLKFKKEWVTIELGEGVLAILSQHVGRISDQFPPITGETLSGALERR
jgi:hypothetical protein